MPVPARMPLLPLRWCPQCGRVDVDSNAELLPIRVGDTQCPREQARWSRGTLVECNKQFAGRFPYIPANLVRERWRQLRYATVVASRRKSARAARTDPDRSFDSSVSS